MYYDDPFLSQQARKREDFVHLGNKRKKATWSERLNK